MELKRILARDSRAANDKALQLYGPDVLVISSQRVDNQTELIVAIDTQEDALAAEPKALHPVAPSPDQDRFVAFSEVFKVSIESPEPAAPEALAVADATVPVIDREQVVSVSTVQEQQQADADDLRRSRDTVELLRQEIAALRQEFNLNRQVAMWQSGQGLSAELTAWFSHMQELGVPASWPKP